jgi:hypothetical protein
MGKVILWAWRLVANRRDQKIIILDINFINNGRLSWSYLEHVLIYIHIIEKYNLKHILMKVLSFLNNFNVW